jgi:hypothetical protein
MNSPNPNLPIALPAAAFFDPKALAKEIAKEGLLSLLPTFQ